VSEPDILFSAMGGTFCSPLEVLRQKLSRTRAVIFDWDGVFNNGQKADAGGSPFSEPDAMGVNLLRFSFWLRTGQIPATAILTGEENKGALYLAQREHYASVYFKSTDKVKSFQHFIKHHRLNAEEVIFIFDDVLDLALAELCGVRIQVGRKATPLFNEFVKEHQLADYVTGSDGNHFAVREACELLMGLSESYSGALENRMRFSSVYQDYLRARDENKTELYYLVNGEVRHATQLTRPAID
jgi:3-deoxy-D-manno-octulosonate 8-phosphate phosphatase (KDO 8-P phosphatase)